MEGPGAWSDRGVHNWGASGPNKIAGEPLIGPVSTLQCKKIAGVRTPCQGGEKRDLIDTPA